MIHAIFEELDYALEITDRHDRLRVPALGASEDRLPPGHYRVARFVEHRPWSTSKGPGHIELADLDEAAVDNLVNAGRAVRRSDDDLLAINGVVGPLGGLARRGTAAEAVEAVVSIHGGGVGDDAIAPFQRLMPPLAGCVRVHNADLERIAQRFFSGSAAIRVGVLSVVAKSTTV